MNYTPGHVTVTNGYQPTADEIENDRLSRCRPADRSAAATREALAAIVLERAVSDARLLSAQDRVEGALLGHPNDLRRAREALARAQDEADQYSARQAAMQTTLEKREREEDAARGDLARLAQAAEERAARFRTFLTRDYQKHAAAIAAGLALEKDALHADMVLTEAMKAWPGVPAVRPDIPRTATGTSYGHLVFLPGHASPAVPAAGPYGRS